MPFKKDALAKNLLLILTRNPELGKCKTRLAAEVGNQAALEIYGFLLRHTRAITLGLPMEKWVLYSEQIWEEDIWDPAIYQKKLQRGDDLGQRMENAFREGFRAGFGNIVIIGSDLHDLSQGDLETAFSLLEAHDHVLGPAQDGGYYLLGMKVLDQKVFRDKAWSSDTVLADTLVDLQGKKVALLPERNDVDHYKDIKDIKVFAPFIKHMDL